MAIRLQRIGREHQRCLPQAGRQRAAPGTLTKPRAQESAMPMRRASALCAKDSPPEMPEATTGRDATARDERRRAVIEQEHVPPRWAPRHCQWPGKHGQVSSSSDGGHAHPARRGQAGHGQQQIDIPRQLASSLEGFVPAGDGHGSHQDAVAAHSGMTMNHAFRRALEHGQENAGTSDVSGGEAVHSTRASRV